MNIYLVMESYFYSLYDNLLNFIYVYINLLIFFVF